MYESESKMRDKFGNLLYINARVLYKNKLHIIVDLQPSYLQIKDNNHILTVTYKDIELYLEAWPFNT